MINRRLNILFSTTRQWNPGDEFILYGIINLLNELQLKFNPIIYNRNPHIRPMYSYLNPLRFSHYLDIPYKEKEIIEAFFRVGFLDNSFKDEMDLSFIDLVIFAGTPEWKTPRLLTLYQKLLNFLGKILYIGIGSAGVGYYENLSDLHKTILKKAEFISVRDKYTWEMLRLLNPLLLPCPSIFASTNEKIIKEVKHIGLVFSTNKSVPFNRITAALEIKLVSLYKTLIKKLPWKISLICHYIDELPIAYQIFGKDVEIYYSYDALDYISIYKNFDLIISPRIHGSGLASSLGIPSIVIPHDLRVDAAYLFLAHILPDLDYRTLEMFITQIINNIKLINRNLISYKLEMKKMYKTYLSNIFQT